MANFVNDTFTDAGTNTLLENHTPELGGPWVKHPTSAGSMSIPTGTNRVTGSGGEDFYFATATEGAIDQDVEADVVLLSTLTGGAGGVCVGMDTTAKTFYAFSYVHGTGLLLRKSVAATGSNLFTVSGKTLAVSASVHVKLQWRSSGLLVMSADGVQVAQFTDTAIASAGHVGVRSSLGTTTTGAAVDSFTASDPGPIANAGAAQAARPNATVTLDASASTAYGGRTVASYAWTVLGNNAADITLSDATAQKPTFTAPNKPGFAYSFGLAVTDSAGATSTQAITSVGIEDAASTGSGARNVHVGNDFGGGVHLAP